MEIPLFQADTPLRFDRIVLYPYPDQKRVWTRLWLTAVNEENHPNIEIVVYNPDGSENCSVYMMAHAEQRAETTLHMRNPSPEAIYTVVAELTQGMGDEATVLDKQTFPLMLDFRNPDLGEPGFGYGVDWDDVKRKASAQ